MKKHLQDARLWYGIGLLYDCYGSYGHAIEAFDACLKMDPNFELDHEVIQDRILSWVGGGGEVQAWAGAWRVDHCGMAFNSNRKYGFQ